MREHEEQVGSMLDIGSRAARAWRCNIQALYDERYQVAKRAAAAYRAAGRGNGDHFARVGDRISADSDAYDDCYTKIEGAYCVAVGHKRSASPEVAARAQRLTAYFEAAADSILMLKETHVYPTRQCFLSCDAPV